MSVTLSPFGEEFGQVEHQLRLQLKAPQCVVDEMQIITLKASETQFNNELKKMENPNIVDVFVDLDAIGKTPKEVETSGIIVSSKTGYKLCTTDIKLTADKEVYNILHITVALGKVFNYMNPLRALESDEYENIANVTCSCIPDGFDSLRISGKNEFLVFKQQQINPVHLLKVRGGANILQKKLDCFVCDSCKNSPATLYCINDQMKLCNNCDNKIHKVSEVSKKHDRKPLNETLPLFQDCPEHPGNKVQYYCPTCHLPVCMECKVSGNHSRRDSMKHKLTPICDAYKQIGGKVQKPNQIRQTREKTLKQSLAEGEETLQALQSNLKSMVDEINKIAKAAIAEATAMTADRVLLVKSSICELQRKYDQLKQQREFLVDYYSSGEPVPFLQTYHRTELFDKNIETALDLQRATSIKSDLAVYGRLEISPPKPKESSPLKVVDRDIHVGGLTNHTTWTETDTRAAHNDGITFGDLSKPVKFTSLDKMADRKVHKYADAGKELNFTPFEGSEIIKNPELARKLYLCFPFKAMPETHLMFSTTTDGRDIQQMHKLVDGKGISVIIIRAQGRVFGGFAASKWTNDSIPFGEGTSSFLFSIDNNAFIPARPQSEDPIYLLGTPETFSFGRDDLVIAGNFERCASSIENTFGIGLPYGSETAQKFLAGTPRFRADDVEVWGFFSQSQ